MPSAPGEWLRPLPVSSGQITPILMIGKRPLRRVPALQETADVEAIPGWSSATPQWDSPRAHRPSLSTGINRRCRSRTRAARTARCAKGNTHRPGGTAPSGHDVLGPLDVQQGELAVHTHAKLETELSPLLVADRNCRSAGRTTLLAPSKVFGALSWPACRSRNRLPVKMRTSRDHTDSSCGGWPMDMSLPGPAGPWTWSPGPAGPWTWTLPEARPTSTWTVRVTF